MPFAVSSRRESPFHRLLRYHFAAFYTTVSHKFRSNRQRALAKIGLREVHVDQHRRAVLRQSLRLVQDLADLVVAPDHQALTGQAFCGVIAGREGVTAVLLSRSLICSLVAHPDWRHCASARLGPEPAHEIYSHALMLFALLGYRSGWSMISRERSTSISGQWK